MSEGFNSSVHGVTFDLESFDELDEVVDDIYELAGSVEGLGKSIAARLRKAGVTPRLATATDDRKFWFVEEDDAESPNISRDDIVPGLINS